MPYWNGGKTGYCLVSFLLKDCVLYPSQGLQQYASSLVLASLSPSNKLIVWLAASINLEWDGKERLSGKYGIRPAYGEVRHREELPRPLDHSIHGPLMEPTNLQIQVLSWILHGPP